MSMWVAGLYAHVVISINAHCTVVGSGQPGRREPSIIRLVGDAELGEARSTEKTCIWFRGLRHHRRWQSRAKALTQNIILLLKTWAFFWMASASNNLTIWAFLGWHQLALNSTNLAFLGWHQLAINSKRPSETGTLWPPCEHQSR